MHSHRLALPMFRMFFLFAFSTFLIGQAIQLHSKTSPPVSLTISEVLNVKLSPVPDMTMPTRTLSRSSQSNVMRMGTLTYPCQAQTGWRFWV